MTTINATSARKDIYKLISDVNTNSDLVTITGKNRKNAVLISEADWKNIREGNLLVNVKNIPRGKNGNMQSCILKTGREGQKISETIRL